MLSQVPATSVSAPPLPPSPSPQYYTLDGAPVTLAELLEHNDFSPEELAQIESLPPGQSMHLGGGAAPVFKLTRVAERSPVPDFRPWSNAERFVLIERLLKSLADEPTCPSPVVEVARLLIGKVRFAGYQAALSGPPVSDVDVEAISHPARWVLVVALSEWIDEQWDEDSVEHYDVGQSWEEVLHHLAGVDAATLITAGGAR